MSDPRRRWRVTRRGFLIGTGALAGTLAIGIGAGLPFAQLRIAQSLDGASSPGELSSEPFAWFEITPENSVRFYTPKVEMGQGIHTALAQIAAEELELSWEQLEIVQATTSSGPQDASGTQGSSSVTSSFTPIREAAATLREMLRVEAARQLNVPADDLTLREGRVETAGGDQLTYGQIVSRAGEWQVPDEIPALKSPSDYRIIGQPLPRRDIPAKVTGEARYGYDARVEGMLYGSVLHPPTIEGKLRRLVNAEEVKKMPGVVMVVEEAGFAGVVAERRPQAWAARDALIAEWDEGKKWQQEEIEEIVSVGGRGATVVQKEGQGAAALTGNALTAEYRTPLAVHASMEMQGALADIQADSARIWVSTQMQSRVAADVAGALGREEREIEVVPLYLGGGFGRKGIVEVAVEAARLSAAAGRPVHVGWARQEEMRHGYFRPPTHSRLSATLQDGKVFAIEHQQASGDVLFAYFPGFLQVIFGADFGAWRGATIHYAIPHRQTSAWRRKVPVATGPWRGLGIFANVFAVESFMDELAHHAGVDPLQFRLDHLPEGIEGERMRDVLEAVRESSSWDSPPPDGHARGVALNFDAGTWNAQVVEVSLGQEGRPRVHRVWAVQDCGLVINPDGARAQVEGNIMWAVGSTLIESVRVRDGAVDLRNFDSYPLLTIAEAPDVEVILIDPSRRAEPAGVGEPAIGPAGAAIANALFALTGVRLRELPITADRIRAALGALS